MSSETPDPGAFVRVDVSTLHLAHPRIRAEDWRSPLIGKLLGTAQYVETSCEMHSAFRGVGEPEVCRTLSLSWTGLAEDFQRCWRTYQGSVLTEFAALAVACILLSLDVNLEITEVTRRGEKADYWIGDGQFLIEVSGQSTGNLTTLLEQKVKQLQSNPFGKGGFVCVSDFSSLNAILWFHV